MKTNTTKIIVTWLKTFALNINKNNYIYCQKMNKATRNPQEVYEEAQEFLEFTRPLLHGPHRNRHWIFNMDQMSLYFSYHSSKTDENCGSKTIHVWKTSNGTKRVTGVLTLTAAGDFLTPMIIFQGKPGGMIEKKELPKFNPSSIYACQAAAWMDERCMMLWVDQILGPYLAVNPPPPGIQHIDVQNIAATSVLLAAAPMVCARSPNNIMADAAGMPAGLRCTHTSHSHNGQRRCSNSLALCAGSSAHGAVLAPLIEGGACTTFPVKIGGGGGHGVRLWCGCGVLFFVLFGAKPHK
jgi:hypothetical protein